MVLLDVLTRFVPGLSVGSLVISVVFVYTPHVVINSEVGHWVRSLRPWQCDDLRGEAVGRLLLVMH